MSKWLGVLVLIVCASALLAACSADFFGEPNDAQHDIERSRANRPPDSPEQLPPGLGADLPPPATQPTPQK
ncbi:MAG TPA: hypothetical protein VH253_03355 [Phycisphaerae bacterium]|nr:hypothetical protein [Phycisphaerae bacterium]